jgi:GWxTD domain-containing protein
MKKKALVFLIVLTAVVFPQHSREKMMNPRSSLPAFYCDFFNHKSADSTLTSMDVFAQVPFNKIHFYKTENGFRGEYTITVSVYDTTKTTLLQEHIKDESVHVDNFGSTQSTKNFKISVVSFALAPQSYMVVTVIEDKDSKLTYKVEHQVKVPAYKYKVSASDIFIISNQKLGDGNKLIPNIARVITTKQNSLPIYFEIYSDSIRPVSLTFKVFSADDTLQYRVAAAKLLQPGKNPISFSLDSLNLPYGEYALIASITDTSTKLLASIKKGFSMWSADLPFYVRDIDKAIEQMQYIANSSEMDSLKSKRTYDEKVRAFYAFWKKKDPNPTTEENEYLLEYYRRVEYANRNFSHYTEGWKTDMGMVYIYLGTPNNVDSHPFELDSKPYEVWEYNELNLDVVFVDYSGFGDYRLITQLPAEAYKFR